MSKALVLGGLAVGMLALLLVGETKPALASSGGVGGVGGGASPDQAFGSHGENLAYPSLPPGVVYFDAAGMPNARAYQDASIMLALWDSTTVPGLSAPKSSGFGSAENPGDIAITSSTERFAQELIYYVAQRMGASSSGKLTPEVLDNLFANSRAILASMLS